MQILIDSVAAERVKLTKTEAKVLVKAAQLMRRIGRNVLADDETDGKVADALDATAKDYGPKPEAVKK